MRVGVHFIDGRPTRFDHVYSWMEPPGAPADVEVGLRRGGDSDAAPAADTVAPADEFRTDGGCITGWQGASVTVRRSGEPHRWAGVYQPEDAGGGPFGVAVLEAATGAVFAEVFARGGLVLHAATLAFGGRAFVVCGQSGRGKSTLVGRLPAAHLHEEHAFLVPTADGWTFWRLAQARGPWDDRTWHVPVAGILLLSEERDVTRVSEVAPADGLAGIVRTLYWMGAALGPELLERAARLAATLPVSSLAHCLATPSDDVAAAIMASAGRARSTAGLLAAGGEEAA